MGNEKTMSYAAQSRGCCDFVRQKCRTIEADSLVLSIPSRKNEARGPTHAAARSPPPARAPYPDPAYWILKRSLCSGSFSRSLLTSSTFSL